jgi:hypothetical protein
MVAVSGAERSLESLAEGCEGVGALWYPPVCWRGVCLGLFSRLFWFFWRVFLSPFNVVLLLFSARDT